jgi:hypothetical protein
MRGQEDGRACMGEGCRVSQRVALEVKPHGFNDAGMQISSSGDIRRAL